MKNIFGDFSTFRFDSFPVKTFQFYINHFDPNYPDLWQQPKPKITWEDEVWYLPQPISKNRIGGQLSILSKEAQLSRKYTNHCVRSTSITLLDNAGIPPFPLFHIALQGSFIRVVHSILPHGLCSMAKLAIQCNPSPVPFYPPLWLVLCDV